MLNRIKGKRLISLSPNNGMCSCGRVDVQMHDGRIGTEHVSVFVCSPLLLPNTNQSPQIPELSSKQQKAMLDKVKFFQIQVILVWPRGKM